MWRASCRCPASPLARRGQRAIPVRLAHRDRKVTLVRLARRGQRAIPARPARRGRRAPTASLRPSARTETGIWGLRTLGSRQGVPQEQRAIPVSPALTERMDRTVRMDTPRSMDWTTARRSRLPKLHSKRRIFFSQSLIS